DQRLELFVSEHAIARVAHDCRTRDGRRSRQERLEHPPGAVEPGQEENAVGRRSLRSRVQFGEGADAVLSSLIFWCFALSYLDVPLAITSVASKSPWQSDSPRRLPPHRPRARRGSCRASRTARSGRGAGWSRPRP